MATLQTHNHSLARRAGLWQQPGKRRRLAALGFPVAERQGYGAAITSVTSSKHSRTDSLFCAAASTC